jgi:hypothetical protein
VLSVLEKSADKFLTLFAPKVTAGGTCNACTRPYSCDPPTCCASQTGSLWVKQCCHNDRQGCLCLALYKC